MQNYVTGDCSIDITLGSGETAFASGTLYLVGAMVGVISSLTRNGQTVFSNQASAQGDIAVVALEGVYTLPKATGAIGIGAKVYYDATNKNLTTTASGNTFTGYAYAAALSGDATLPVLLARG